MQRLLMIFTNRISIANYLKKKEKKIFSKWFEIFLIEKDDQARKVRKMNEFMCERKKDSSQMKEQKKF